MQLTVPAGDSRVRQLACFKDFWEMIASKVHTVGVEMWNEIPQ